MRHDTPLSLRWLGGPPDPEVVPGKGELLLTGVTADSESARRQGADIVPGRHMHESNVTISKRTSRRIGYGVAIAVNAAMLVFVNNVLDWGWFGWLTEDLNDVLPLINLSLAASIVSNAVYMVNDSPAVKGLIELVVNAISLIATIRLLQVFPFDFSDYSSIWETATRGILIAAIVGISIALLVQLAKLAQLATKLAEGSHRADS